MNPELSASSIQYSTSFTTLKPPLSMILLSYLAPICMLNLHTRATDGINYRRAPSRPACGEFDDGLKGARKGDRERRRGTT